MSVISFQKICLEFEDRVLLDEVSFSVERRECVALVGPNGAGKTTLMRIALGKVSADEGHVIISRGVRVGYLSQETGDLAAHDDSATALQWAEVTRLERKIRAAEQRMASAGDDAELFKEYDKLIRQYEAMDGYTLESRIKQTLMGLGLREEVMDTPLQQLSSGEMMRVVLARILLSEPDLLILDEPTNHLDIAGMEWLEEFLKKFAGGVLVISHDRFFLDQVATRVIELSGATTTEIKGNYTTFLQQKDIRRDFLQKERFRIDEELERERQMIRVFKQQGKDRAAKSRERTTLARLLREREELAAFRRQQHLDSTGIHLDLRQAGHISRIIADAKGLTKRYGERILFENVDLLIHGGERIGIIGSNGCGKTTLLKILMGQEEPSEGTGRIGSWVKFAYLSQNLFFEDERRSMLEEVIAHRPEYNEPAVRDQLARLQFFGPDVYKPINLLSGGERVRLYLCCALLHHPDCLIMDEPTNHLDLAAREAIETALRKFSGTVIAISHDRYFLNHCVSRILVFEETHIRSFRGNYDAYHASLRLPVRETEEKHKERVKEIVVNAEDIPKQTRKELEEEIAWKETALKELEAQFGDCPPEVYQEYHEIDVALQELYRLWEELQE